MTQTLSASLPPFCLLYLFLFPPPRFFLTNSLLNEITFGWPRDFQQRFTLAARVQAVTLAVSQLLPNVFAAVAVSRPIA